MRTVITQLPFLQLGEQRIEKLLRRSMWHLHWENGRVSAEVRAKLEVIPGDLLAEHCGISAPQRRRLAKEVDYVVHCAASISFTEHVHTLLAHNFEVRHLLRLWYTSPIVALMIYCQDLHGIQDVAEGGRLQTAGHPQPGEASAWV